MGIVSAIYKWANGRNILLTFLIAIICGAIISLGIVPQIDEITSGIGLLDTRFFYSFEDVIELFDALSAQGLMLYTNQKIVDMVFPLGYALPLAMIQALINKKAFSEGSRASYLVLLPILGMFLDYGENIFIATQIVAYPILSQPVVVAASIATLLKWTTLSLSFVCVVAVLLIWLITRRSS
ncbi:hypothetical protein EU524_00805 [Candidatus Thorarchaeota archaeon]|nr:MAG: hypothetical protein EU524_00805 [Candidatus Thorarchaeota archaeon]